MYIYIYTVIYYVYIYIYIYICVCVQYDTICIYFTELPCVDHVIFAHLAHLVQLLLPLDILPGSIVDSPRNLAREIPCIYHVFIWFNDVMMSNEKFHLILIYLHIFAMFS